MPNCGELGHIALISKSKPVNKFQRSSQANKKPFGTKHQYPNRGQRTNKVTAKNDEQKLPVKWVNYNSSLLEELSN